MLLFSSVTNSGPIDGTLVAASYTGNGALHSNPYSGMLPVAQQSGNPGNAVAAPEPASLALIATAMSGWPRSAGGGAQAKAARPPG